MSKSPDDWAQTKILEVRQEDLQVPWLPQTSFLSLEKLISQGFSEPIPRLIIMGLLGPTGSARRK